MSKVKQLNAFQTPNSLFKKKKIQDFTRKKNSQKSKKEFSEFFLGSFMISS